MFAGNNIAIGTVEGTGSAINVQIGWVPRAVLVFNIDGDCYGVWADVGFGADDAQKTVDSGSGTTDVSTVTSGGITAYAGTAAGDKAGFTIGTDTDLNVSAQTIVYMAFR